jgi:hypothetical protein
MNHAPFLVVDLITTDEDRKFEPAGRMASAIIDLLQRQKVCRPLDLTVMGFAPGEVEDYWHMAHALAAVELKLMSEKE